MKRFIHIIEVQRPASKPILDMVYNHIRKTWEIAPQTRVNDNKKKYSRKNEKKMIQEELNED